MAKNVGKITQMGTTFLDDDFEISESRENGFTLAINEMSKNTVYELVRPERFLIFSLIEPIDNNGNMKVIRLNPDYMDMKLFMPRSNNDLYFRKETGNAGVQCVKKFKELGFTNTQIKEIERSGFFLQYQRDNGATITLIPSKAFLSTLCRQLGIGKLNEGIDPIRDIFIASKLRYADKFMLVYRKAGNALNGHGKAFGCFTPKFSHTPQTIAFDFKNKLSEFGTLSIRYWCINHFLTNVDFAFNNIGVRVEKTKITPGVRLTLSDVGDSSYRLQNALYLNGGTVLFEDLSMTRRHSGELKVEDMVSEYRNVLYPRLNDAIAVLETLDVIKVSNKNLAIKRIMKKIGFAAAIGVTNATGFKRKYLSDSNEGCTALDVALYMLKIPGIIKSQYKISVIEKASACVGKIFDLNWEEIFDNL